MRRTIICLLTFAAVLVLPAAGRAQVFKGVVLDRELNKPVLVCAVTLIDYFYKVRAVGITDTEGRYELVAPGPGTYRVRADPQGYNPTYSGDYIVEAGDTVEVNILVSVDENVPVETTTRRQELAPGCIPPEGVATEPTPETCDGRWAVEVYNCYDEPIGVYDNSGEGKDVLIGDVAALEHAVLFHPWSAHPSVSVRPTEHGVTFLERSKGLIAVRVYCDTYWRPPGPR